MGSSTSEKDYMLLPWWAEVRNIELTWGTRTKVAYTPHNMHISAFIYSWSFLCLIFIDLKIVKNISDINDSSHVKLRVLSEIFFYLFGIHHDQEVCHQVIVFELLRIVPSADDRMSAVEAGSVFIDKILNLFMPACEM